MKILDKTLFQYDYKMFYSFFEHCKGEAREKKQAQVASISLEIECVDPLVLLQSIYGVNDRYFYFEHPEDIAIAGAEPILEGVFEGSERFKETQDFSKRILQNTIISQWDNVDAGPYFFTSFTFNDKVKNYSEKQGLFPAASVFLATWQIVRKNFQSFITINQVIDSQTDIDCLSKKVWVQYLKFKSFNNFPDFLEEEKEEKVEKQQCIEVGGSNWYENALAKALGYIDSDDIEKIVIARAVEIESDLEYSPLNILNRLRGLYPTCRTCFIGNAKQNFICATPEVLVKVYNKVMIAEAIAGTTSRGKTETEDEGLSKELLSSEKDLHEHQIVIDTILERLNAIGVDGKFQNKPTLKKLANVQHLYTTIEAQLNEGIHILDLARLLHPTPAVCGMPLERSRKLIEELEPFDRGLYSGVIGYFDHQGDGELVVGIRSACISGKKARLYAGGGIVKGSIFENELKETNLKLQAMLGNLLQ